MVRISAAVAAILMATLLAFTAMTTFEEPHVVAPRNGVTDGGPRDGVPGDQAAQQALSDRSRLQGFRAESGPSPKTASGNIAAGRSLEGRQNDLPPADDVERWMSNEQTDWQVLRDRGKIVGISPTLRDPRAPVLQQPAGRDWRRLHNEEITHGGGWVIFGASLILALFLLFRGRVRLKEGFSGRAIERFNGFERANHWFTASSFILLALTGLTLLYGQFFLKPILGAPIYSMVASASIFIHVAFAATFVLGVIVMIFIWTNRNLPRAIDWEWLKRGGGLLRESSENPPAGKFNAGQKLIFWAVVGCGVLLAISGVSLMFPFFWFGIAGMQWMLTIHGGLGLFFMAVIIGHIYIGTVGMEGAFDAMWSGEVDRNWAEEHHDRWFQEEVEADQARQPNRNPYPAE